MGKKQHSKDRMYLTTLEWKHEWGGFKEKSRSGLKRLAYNCCAITFLPFEDPVCTEDGVVYDIVNVVAYIQKYKKHPVTGQPLQMKDLIKLTFHKNADNEYHCPVMNKVFTEHTHIVAIKTTGNVYCWEAIEELCVKPKNWRDLLTDEPFRRSDIIHIQDPLNLSGRSVEEFDHVRNDLVVEEEQDGSGITGLRNASADMQRALGALGTAEAAAAAARGGGGKRSEALATLAAAKASSAATAAQVGKSAGDAKKDASKVSTTTTSGAADWRLQAPARPDGPRFKPGAATWDTEDAGAEGKGGRPAALVNAAPAKSGSKPNPRKWYEEVSGLAKWVEGMSTTGAGSRAFTSSVAAVTTTNARERTLLARTPSAKGYVRMQTSHGDLNIELHADIAPRTVENFLCLCEMGYYEGVTFHRLIKNFMIQGGDPTGTGKGGESIYGPTFRDEIRHLSHDGRGVVAMANSGPGTNGSQFYITFKSCRHLDPKHTIFGRVVGGFDTLSAMEKVPTDDDERPLQPISITGAEVFNNPFREMVEEEKRREDKAAREAERAAVAAGSAAGNPLDTGQQVGNWFSNPSQFRLPGTTSAAEATASISETDTPKLGVGKYLKTNLVTKVASTLQPLPESSELPEPAKKKSKAGVSYGNFDSW